MKPAFVFLLTAWPTLALAEWSFSPVLSIVEDQVDGVFFHLEGSGRRSL